MSDYLEECSIFLDKLSDDNITTVMTTCSHRYHRICLKKWIESNGEYSLCRYSLANDRYIEQNGEFIRCFQSRCFFVFYRCLT